MLSFILFLERAVKNEVSQSGGNKEGIRKVRGVTRLNLQSRLVRNWLPILPGVRAKGTVYAYNHDRRWNADLLQGLGRRTPHSIQPTAGPLSADEINADLLAFIKGEMAATAWARIRLQNLGGLADAGQRPKGGKD